MKTLFSRTLQALPVLLAASVTAAPIDAIRVYAVQPAQFEFLFTAAVGASTTNPLLSFNNSRGRTCFVRVGEALGAYRLVAFEPLTQIATNEHTHARIEQRGGRATLQRPDGQKVVLEMGKPLQVPGWRALVVSMTNGAWRIVQDGENVRLDAAAFHVDRVSEAAVTADAGGQSKDIPFVADAEREKLVAMWQQQEEEQNRQLAQAALPAEEPKSQDNTIDITRRLPRPRETVEFTAPASMSVGTEYRYPTRFIVVPGIQTLNGQTISQPIVVPADFETRSSGTSVISK